MGEPPSSGSQSRVHAYSTPALTHERSRPLTEALPASGEGRDSNPRRRETGVTPFKKKAAAFGHSATSPILRILYSPNVMEEEFSEVRLNGVLLSSLPASKCQDY